MEKCVGGGEERCGKVCGGVRRDVGRGVQGVRSSIWNSRQLCGIVGIAYGISVLGYRET